jgi:hypothetical protein
MMVMASSYRRIALLAVVLALSACSSRRPELGDTLSEGGAANNPLGNIVIPLAVRSFDIASADNQRGVFFKLSRVPDRVSSRSESDPARIIVDAEGPAVGDDLPLQSYPGADLLVDEVRMSRTGGRLQLIVELSTSSPPPYSVHQMADWIMVRLSPSR